MLHFDVNKTVLLTDSIDSKTCDDCVREAVSELFWGHLEERPEGLHWSWIEIAPQAFPPTRPADIDAKAELCTYAKYCNRALKDKKDRRSAMRSFRLLEETRAKERMEKFVAEAAERMKLPPEVANSKKAEQIGLRGSTYLMLPAIFHLTADLVRRKQQFAVVFRSFGKDHAKIQEEWNAFCEMKHPVFSHLLEGYGPLNGTVEGVPDRRLHDIHTLYRDQHGPVLALNTFTNGPPEKSWDSWAKLEPKPLEDTRDGRTFLRDINCTAVEGMQDLHKFFEEILSNQCTIAIKDDWAWWTWNGESSDSGKLLCVLPMVCRQLFFDDNIDWEEPRIVDCRGEDGRPIPKEKSLQSLITKVNPVEALIDNDYFLRALERCHGPMEPVPAAVLEEVVPDVSWEQPDYGWPFNMLCCCSSADRSAVVLGNSQTQTATANGKDFSM